MHRTCAIIACAATAFSGLFTMPGPATAQELAATEPTQGQTFTDLPDFLDQPAYRKYLQQTVAWSTAKCSELFAAQDAATRAYLDDDGDGGDDDGDLAECAKVAAPLDWYHPEAGDITLALYREKRSGPALDSHSKRLLLSNPGGPGGSGWVIGLTAPGHLGASDTHVGVGIDPRGVAGSTPLRCPDKPKSPGAYLTDGDFRNPTVASLRLAQADRDHFIETCQQQNPSLAGYINTDQTARDFNFVRHLLGYSTSDYYGVSYGTWLGAHLERLFPNKFDRVVLEGNIDWSIPRLESVFEHQPQNAQAALDRTMLTFWARHNDVFGLGDHPLAVQRNIDRVIQGAAEGKLGKNTPVTILQQLAQLLNHPPSAGQKGMFLKELLGQLNMTVGTAGAPGTSGTSPPAAAASDEMIDAAYWAIRCGDTVNGTQREELWRQRIGWAHEFPVIGHLLMVNTCAAWQGSPAMNPDIINRPVSQVLMVQQEADGRTGYPGARHARLTAPGNVRMVVADDSMGHGSALEGNQCAFTATSTYLTKGAFPDRDVTCQASPFVTRMLVGKPGHWEVAEARDATPFEFMNPMGPNRSMPRGFGYAMRNFDPAVVDADGPDATTSGAASAGEPAAVHAPAQQGRLAKAQSERFATYLARVNEIPAN